MAKRKQQNMVLERQLKQRKMISRVISIVVAAVIVFGVGFGVWTVQDSRWVLRYDGGRVEVNDFRAVWDAGFGGDPMMRGVALESLQRIVALRDRAVYHNVDFTEAERAEAEEFVQWEIRMSHMMQIGFDPVAFISDERLAELFVTDPLIERLMDIYVPFDSIEIDEAGFAELLETYLEEELHNHLDLQVLSLILDDRDDIEEAYSLIGTMDFEDIVRQFTPGLEEDSEVHTQSAIEMSQWLDGPDDIEHLLGLEAGEYSRIIEWSDDDFEIFFIFYAESRVEPDPDVASESFRNDYIENMRGDMFTDLVILWVEEANFRVNSRGYNSV